MSIPARVQSNLPDEMWLKVFSYFEEPELGKLACVSQYFNALAEDDQLWEQLYTRECERFDIAKNNFYNICKNRIQRLAPTPQQRGLAAALAPAPVVGADPKKAALDEIRKHVETTLLNIASPKERIAYLKDLLTSDPLVRFRTILKASGLRVKRIHAIQEAFRKFKNKLASRPRMQQAAIGSAAVVALGLALKAASLHRTREAATQQ